MIKQFKIIFILLCAMIIITACNKDDNYEYPNLITEFAGLQTDNKGVATSIITDENKTLCFEKINTLSNLATDSIYRIVARYAYKEPSENSFIKLYSIISVIAPYPADKKYFKVQKNDPVKVQSITLSNNYINIVLNVLKKEKKHAFHFIQESIINNEDNTKSVNITLYHDNGGDLEAFYNTSYLSIPIDKYKETLKSGDKIIVTINTYEDGFISYPFEL